MTQRGGCRAATVRMCLPRPIRAGTRARWSISTLTFRSTLIDHFGALWAVDGSGTCDGYFDVQTVLLHEYGHALGLGHPSSSSGCNATTVCPVMDASYGGLQRTPCADDIAGAIAVYAVGAQPKPPAPAGLQAALNGSSANITWSGCHARTRVRSVARRRCLRALVRRGLRADRHRSRRSARIHGRRTTTQASQATCTATRSAPSTRTATRRSQEQHRRAPQARRQRLRQRRVPCRRPVRRRHSSPTPTAHAHSNADAGADRSTNPRTNSDCRADTASDGHA